MNIGFDYDDTFTRDPAAWAEVINLLTHRGHKVYIVTWRTEEECKRVHAEMQYWKVDIEGIYPTNRLAKATYMSAHGIHVDIWVDDNPSAITKTMEGYEAYEASGKWKPTLALDEHEFSCNLRFLACSDPCDCRLSKAKP